MKGWFWTLCVATLATARPQGVELKVSDLDRSAAFYRDKVGLPVVYESEKTIIFENESGKLTLIQSKQAQGYQSSGLVFRTETLDRKRREFLEAGFVVGPIQRWAHGRRWVAQDPDHYEVEFQSLVQGHWKKDIEYVKQGTVSLRLDAFVPEGERRFPAMVVVHGGSFMGGDRDTFVRPILDVLSETGRYVVFSISYRLAPKHRFPSAVEDVQAALSFVREHAAEFKVDATRLGLVGESAGGYLVTMASTRLRPEEQVQGVVSFYGAQDLPNRVMTQGRLVTSLKAFFGVTEPNKATMELLARGSPITWVRVGAPPHLFIHGTQDEQVPFSQSTLMCQRLKQLRADCEVLAIPLGGHGMRGWDIDPFKTFYRDRMIQWLDEHVSSTTIQPTDDVRFVPKL